MPAQKRKYKNKNPNEIRCLRCISFQKNRQATNDQKNSGCKKPRPPYLNITSPLYNRGPANNKILCKEL